MARTNIKVFDEGYQNIMGDDDYNLSVQRTRGVTPGIADPLIHNKLYRQTSIMAKALADYIVSQGQDCLDTDLTNITNALTTALETHTKKNKNILVTETNVAANTVDWNTLTESRTYKITGATFAADKHQPVGAIGTGELVVLKNGDDTIVQVYYANSTEFDKAGAYHRVNIGGTWTDWVYNITNKGGTVTGDFTINGKLTVDEVQVTDKLLIGEVDPANPDTSNFLTKDDLQRIQDQIINPIQNLWVDSIDGNDSNDGLTISTPVKTLDKAVSLINPEIPEIYIRLSNARTTDENKNYSYHLSKAIVAGTSNQKSITITLKSWYIDYAKPTLTIDVNRVRTGGVETADYFIDGTTMIKDFENVTIAGLLIDTTQNFVEKEGAIQLLFYAGLNFNISNTRIKMNNGFIIAKDGNVNLELTSMDTSESSNSYLFCSESGISHINKSLSDGSEKVFIPDENSVYCISQTVPGNYRPNGTNNKFLHKTAASIYPVIS